MPSKNTSYIEPMLATLVDKPFDEPGWVYEIKWDGYRAISYIKNGKVDIRSRNNKSFNEKFYPVYNALLKWKTDAVVDGEIIVVNQKGMADFSDLQNWRSEADGQLVYYVFDLLKYKGASLMDKPLTDRHKKLASIIPKNQDIIRLSELFEINGKEIFNAAEKMELEGIIAKQAGAKYTPGVRSKAWLKIKTDKRQEVIVGGYTKNQDSSKPFSALLVGLFEKKKFKYLGTVGTGFDNRTQLEILKKLKPLIRKTCPFSETPDFNKPSRFRPNPPPATVTWVKPELVAEISYREITRDGALRHPSFKGIREDKNASNIHFEEPVKTEKVVEPLLKNKLRKSSSSGKRKTLLNPTEETQVKKVNGHELKFTNLSKIFWPAQKYTKRDLINYYYQVAPVMLKYLKNRPQTLLRHPNGINGKSFYQKDVKGKVPSWIETYDYYSEMDQRDKEFLVCTDEASLLYIASLGCIEMNPWSSTVDKPDHPDWCIIDLDPDKNTFDQVIKTAQVTKQILDALSVNAFCKTSGSTGLHIYIPLGAKYTYEDSKEFGRAIARLVHKELPKFTSIERLTANRKGKLYIDFLQNRPQATVSAPYSVRPKPGATVSMPLHWDEVKKGLKLIDFTIANAVERIEMDDELFKGVLGKGIDLKKTHINIQKIFK